MTSATELEATIKALENLALAMTLTMTTDARISRSHLNDAWEAIDKLKGVLDEQKFRELSNESGVEHGTNGEAIAYVETWIPKKVAKPGEWEEAKCPTCGASLSIHEGDGYYTHRKWMRYCPNDECHQKLEWF